jgi:TonB family protein
MDPALMQMRVAGLVVDANSSQPVPAAKIAVDYTNQYFYSDIQGYFELSVPEPEAVLQVMQTGYADSLVVVRPGDEHISVGLKTADIIAPIIQHGIKGKGPVSVKKNPAIESHLVFSQYLKAASSLQLTTEPSAARRKVTVTFTVRKDGRPVDVTVVESSRDKTYDDEAVRLIQNGPDWVCPGGEYPCVRRYTFYFR